MGKMRPDVDCINAIHQALCVMVPKYFVFTPLNLFATSLRKVLIGVGTTGVIGYARSELRAVSYNYIYVLVKKEGRNTF